MEAELDQDHFEVVIEFDVGSDVVPSSVKARKGPLYNVEPDGSNEPIVNPPSSLPTLNYYGLCKNSLIQTLQVFSIFTLPIRSEPRYSRIEIFCRDKYRVPIQNVLALERASPIPNCHTTWSELQDPQYLCLYPQPQSFGRNYPGCSYRLHRVLYPCWIYVIPSQAMKFQLCRTRHTTWTIIGHLVSSPLLALGVLDLLRHAAFLGRSSSDALEARPFLRDATSSSSDSKELMFTPSHYYLRLCFLPLFFRHDRLSPFRAASF
ncbi:hypothetical protein R3P38DRAFT_3211742 [Favolaschia claudopus]|uniref:Uncharacterized protein n=1 Tax=Favolaschia claudopus TaxID=2862362 RepID=A0AAW0AG69_9AGAR